jgi:alkylation response protein AidB-like acyl-CoA dehydrogenase
MDLRDTQAEAAFRTGLRSWLPEAIAAMPARPDPEDWPGRRVYDTTWQRMLFDAGYAGVNWPVEYGGRGASPAEQLIFLEETYRAGAPDIGLNFIGLSHAGPTVAAVGSPEQKAARLPGILRGDEIWCQGFSEPSAGSDLAALRTAAVRDGDDYVINGQKIWTSYGHMADWCEILVRTDPAAPKHKGITWLMMPMDSPGLDVRPLRTATGSMEYCEMFLDEVRVPVANRVGAENDGWGVAMVTLTFERGSAMVGLLLGSLTTLDTVVATARANGRWDERDLRTEAGHVRAELTTLWAMTKRTMTTTVRNPRDVSGNVFKLGYTAARQRLDGLSAEVLGRAGLAFGTDAPGHPDPAEERLRTFMVSIAGGTTEIQRNIVAERGLAMPREG